MSSSSRSVHVRGLPELGGLQDKVTGYFQSGNLSAGVAVTRANLLGPPGQAVVTFADQTAAPTQQEYATPPESPTFNPIQAFHWTRVDEREDVTTPDTMSAPSNITIQVSGFKSCPNEEMVRLYFENKERSGGGDIQEIQVRDKTIYIVFKDPTVAPHVLSRDHCLEETTLKLKEVQPRSLDNTRLLVKGFKESTTEETLRSYLEYVGIDEVITVDYGMQPGIALVTFNQISSFDSIITKAEYIPLEGQQLILEKVFIPNAIIVTDLPDTVSRDLLELYFESETKSGGGPIADIKVDSSTGTAVVQFDKAKTVNRVHQKSPHILHNTPVSVKPYYECLGEVVDDDAPGAFKMPQPINIKIKPELISFAFAMPKFVEQLTRKLAEVQAKVDMTVTDIVTISPTLTPEMKGVRKLARHWEDKSQSCAEQFFTQFRATKILVAIQVWRRTKDRFEKGFEQVSNIASKGADIWVQCSDEEDGGGGVVTLTGTTEAVTRAKNICNTFIRETENLLNWEASNNITIQVSGFKSCPNEEMVRLYFENKERSGGGDIQEIQVREKKVFIVFKEPTVAWHVLRQDHHLEETTLKLNEVQQPRSLDNTRLLVKGFKESTTKETLGLYLENISDDEVIAVDYSTKPGVALVTFDKISYFERMEAKARFRPLEGQQLTLERVRIPDDIIVTDLPDTVSRELLELYFDSETKSGGGPIADIKMDSSTGTAVVQFDDVKTVNRVHQTSPHILHNTPVSVKPYYECLVEVVDDDAPGAFRMPQPINIKIKPELIPFAFAMPKFVEQLTRRLAEVHAKVDMTVTDIVKISPTLTPEMKGVRKLARYWEDNSRSCVEQFFTQFQATKILVAIQVWRRTKDRFESKVSNAASKGDDLWVQCSDDDNSGGGVVTLIGTTEAVTEAKLVCNTFIRETTELLNWEASNNITIQVSGFKSCPNEEMVRLYFENKKRSGGGDIQDIQVGDKTIYIVFKDPTVAWHVLRRDHCPNETILKLKEVQVDDTHLLVKGFKESTTEEALKLYLENVGVDEVITVDYGMQPGIALVTFNQISNFERMVAQAQFRPLDGQHLTLERVPVPDAIIVTDLPDTVSRDLPDTVSRDMLELYFESETKSGGGPISDIKMDSSTGTAVVQFDDANTVNRVHQKSPHILNNTPVSVKPYYECLVEVVDDNAPGAFRMPQPINIKIKPELIPFAFAMPKFGEQLSRRLAEVHAKVDMTVTDIVTISPTLTLEMKGVRKLARYWEDKSRSCVEQFFTQFRATKILVAIQVWRRTKDRFESKVSNAASKGDDLWVQCSDDDNSGGGVVTLIGTTEAVTEAKLVCNTFIRETTELLNWEASNNITIQVSGFKSCPNEEMMRLYFENKERSGGGDIQEIQVRDKTIYIVFKDPTVAWHVLRRDHCLNETILKLKEVQPDDTHLLVKGFKESTTEEILRLYLQLEYVDEVFTVDYGMQPGIALVTFNQISNFERMVAQAQFRPLDGQHLTLERVPVPDAIIVTDLPDTVSRDLLELYFESERKSGGGPISDIKMDSSTGTAVVQFDDTNTVNRVHQKSPHILHNTPVSVKPYYECLVEVVDDNAPGAFRMPQPINIKIKPELISFAFAMPKFVEQLTRKLSEVHAKVDMTVTDIVIISPTLMPEMKGVRKLARYWEDKSRSCVEQFFTQFQAMGMHVATNIWQRAKERFEQVSENVSNVASEGGDIWAQCSDEEGGGVVTLIGTTEAVTRAKQDCKTVIKETEELLKWEATIVTDNINNMKAAQLKFLELNNFQAKHPDVEIKFDVDNQSVDFKGQQALVQQAKIDLYETTNELAEERVSLSHGRLSYLKSDKGRKHLEDSLKKNGIKTAFAIEGEEMSILAQQDSEVKVAKYLLQQVVAESPVAVAEESHDLLTTQGFASLSADLQRRLSVDIHVTKEYVWVVGPAEKVVTASKGIKSYIAKNTIITINMDVAEGTTKFLDCYHNTAVRYVERNQCVEITIDQGKLSMRGTKDGIQNAMKQLQVLIDNVATDTMIIAKPGIHKFFTEVLGSTLLKGIEKEVKCVIVVGGKQDLVHLSELPEGPEQLPQLGLQIRPSSPGGAASGTAGSSNTLTTPEGITILLKKGDITAEKADVLVNTTDGDLDLSQGGVAKAFGQAGGQELQQLCNIGKANAGDVVITQPAGTLRCKEVYHAILSHWQESDQPLRTMLQDCLYSADNDSYTSIAFPALGTGNLQYPHDVAASCMYDEILFFSQSNPGTTLKDVRIIVFDQPTVQAFETALRVIQGVSGASGTATGSGPYSAVTTPKPGQQQMTIGSVTLQIQGGDLTTENVDCIVNVTSKDLGLRGPMAQAICEKAGPSIAAECQQYITKNGQQDHGDVVLTGAGNLPYKGILHLTHPNANVLKESIQTCLQVADTLRFKSIAFPAVGTGGFKISPDQAASLMMDGVTDFAQKGAPPSLITVRITVFQQQMLQNFHSEMDRRAQDLGHKTKRFKSRFKIAHSLGKQSLVAKILGLTLIDRKRSVGDRVSTPQPLLLHFFGSDVSEVDVAKRRVQETVDGNFKEEKIDDPAVQQLSQYEVEMLKVFGHQNNVSVKVEQSDCHCITIQGIPDVATVLSKVWAVLHAKKEEARKLEQALSLQKDISWCYEHPDGTYVPFDPLINLQIEQAYKKNKKGKVQYEDDVGQCEIDFSTMKEKASGQTSSVHRDDLKARAVTLSAVPSQWDPQPMDPKSKKPKLCHLVKLKSSSTEYKTVSSKFGLGNIVSIERVQNPTLWSQYCAQKQKISLKNPGKNIEQELWHGSSADSCVKIYYNGFNRSYAGVHGVLIGQGTYFAVNASYSAGGYASPDASGHKRLFLAKVLTGLSTPGNSRMKVPPPRPGGGPLDTYDSTCGDDIFCVFHDAQAYPEYLITFT